MRTSSENLSVLIKSIRKTAIAESCGNDEYDAQQESNATKRRIERRLMSRTILQRLINSSARDGKSNGPNWTLFYRVGAAHLRAH